ncbi:hypothetical protein TrST_g12854 [Triparma strigata]|uniref:Uncharacterized protein n=1 Tax=Triparma strigata TaxID=1606541 RepID=A0A9W7EYR6_9STRA|nr:hypothetical protein TrST_g12854 [Triparma strigata]
MAPKHTTGENDAEQVERGTGMIGGQERGKKKTTKYDRHLDVVRRKPTVFEDEDEEEEEEVDDEEEVMEEVDDDDKRRSGTRTKKRKKKVTEVMKEEDTARKKKGRKKIEVVERDKWGNIVRTCEIAGCQFKTGFANDMKNHKAAKHGIDVV